MMRLTLGKTRRKTKEKNALMENEKVVVKIVEDQRYAHMIE